MNSALLAVLCIGAFFLAYNTYAKWLERSLFKTDSEERNTPAHEFQDGIDYVPTKPSVLFGHHFSSVAGAAPIVGPAIAIMWGWLPAVIWIVLGVIFMGAAHDFGALVLSIKHQGKSLANVTGALAGKRARLLFLIIVFFLVWMVIAVFTLIIANLFLSFPSAVLPVNFEIIIAITMGLIINKKGKGNLLWPSLIAQALLFVMIWLGTIYPIDLNEHFGSNGLMIWIALLLIYSWCASVLPVWILLQPRDYINSHQLFLGLGLMIAGLILVQPTITAPMLNLSPEGAPPWFPFLFITIACGAISGFHGLVSAGTTSKQLDKPKDARKVAYGGMLGEGLLALLATLAVATGFKTTEQWHSHYSNWTEANGLTAKIDAFVIGAGQFLEGLGITTEISRTVIAVLIISFAATSLDTATRIQRYIIGELGENLGVKSLSNRYIGSALAVLSAFGLMMMGQGGGKGGLLIWPLFGATNQMLASLCLIMIALWLVKMKRQHLPFTITALLITFITTIGLYYNFTSFLESSNYPLMSLTVILFMAQIWIIIEAVGSLKELKRRS